jgi:hypothetical protein
MVVTLAGSTPAGSASVPGVVLLTTISLLTVKLTGVLAETSDEGLM